MYFFSFSETIGIKPLTIRQTKAEKKKAVFNDVKRKVVVARDTNTVKNQMI
jgi:hypothetical protein